MTYGRGHLAGHKHPLGRAVVGHSAELVRGDFRAKKEGPLIRASCRRRVFDMTGIFSPRGEGVSRALRGTHATTSFSAAA